MNYRLQPYTMQEGALDLGRAVRYVRNHAGDYGIEEEDIAVIGFSAGGILWGELLLNFDGTVNGTSIDPNYVPDELDRVSADAGAVGMIYSFYGRLSVASTDVEKFRNSDLPPRTLLTAQKTPLWANLKNVLQPSGRRVYLWKITSYRAGHMVLVSEMVSGFETSING